MLNIFRFAKIPDEPTHFGLSGIDKTSSASSSGSGSDSESESDDSEEERSNKLKVLEKEVLQIIHFTAVDALFAYFILFFV